MATRRSFLAVLGMGLFSAAAAWAASPGSGLALSVPASDPVDTVRRYLAYRATNEWAKAYTLLSASTQRELPLDQFSQVKTLPSNPMADGMTPALSALSALFTDAGDTLGYRFAVVGIAPEDPHVVLVSAQSGAAAGQAASPLALRIVTAPDPQTGTVRIELMPSYQKTDPVGFERARERARQTTSLSNLKQIGLAMIVYMQDHDERCPAADRWVDAITPYLVGTQGSQAQREQTLASLFHDPTSPDSQKWSYAFNSNLSGLTQAQMDSVAKTVLVFESNAGVKNAADTGQSMPRPGRHSGGTDYAFADGHCRWVSDKLTDTQRNEMLSFSPSGK